MQPPKLYRPLQQQPIFYRLPAALLCRVYQLVIFVRNFLYDRGLLQTHRLPGVCISVGNITVGGAGKSPVVIEVARKLLNHGARPVILTRGYKSSLKSRDAVVLLAGKILLNKKSKVLAHLPDEAMMQSQRLPNVPVVVGKDRASAAQWFLANSSYNPTHWILDDGFQHRKVHRDLEIVLLDAEAPFGNGHLLPLGSLREPIAGLKRADMIGFTRASVEAPSSSIQSLVAKHTPSPQVPISFVSTTEPIKEPALLMTGIAYPDRLATQLIGQGLPIASTYFVRDHENFQPFMLQKKMKNCACILTTEKDFWRQPEFFTGSAIPFFTIELKLLFLPRDEKIFTDTVCFSQKKS